MSAITTADRLLAKRKFGIFTHFLAHNEPGGWDKTVNNFDVPTLATTLSDIGAGWYFITLMQGRRYMCAPNAAFDAIAVTITPGKVVEGTIEDTIPAGFVLTPESEAELEAAGWTVTVNADGTTTLFSPTVKADEDGETFTYEIQYQGNGYGAEYTNVEAKYIYEGIDDETEASTVSGWVMEKTEKIPQEGDSFECGSWHAVVRKADDRHVQEIELVQNLNA